MLVGGKSSERAGGVRLYSYSYNPLPCPMLGTIHQVHYPRNGFSIEPIKNQGPAVKLWGALSCIQQQVFYANASNNHGIYLDREFSLGINRDEKNGHQRPSP